MLDRRQMLACVAAAMTFPGLAAQAESPLSIVTTTGMIADAARIVAGDAADVRALMGPGVDPHAYRQTRSDIVATAQADLVLWNGLYLEAQMEDFLRDLAGTTTVVAVAESIPAERLQGSEDYAERFDPHVWMDPALWSEVVVSTRDALISVAPDDAAMFTANADAYLQELDTLDAYTRTALSEVPGPSRVLLTAHDAFGYFGAAYGFEVIGIQGISTESEAGLQRMSELVDVIVERDIRAIFVETSVSDRNIRALIEGAAAQGHDVVIGGELFSDAMGPDGTYRGTYLGMIDHNTTTIAAALGTGIDEGGMKGLLN